MTVKKCFDIVGLLCDKWWNGTVRGVKKELFLNHIITIGWHLSVVEQRAARKRKNPRVIEPVHLPRTHTCTCTLPQRAPVTLCLTSLLRTGEYIPILMEKWWPWLFILDISLINGWDTFNACMCFLLLDGPANTIYPFRWEAFAALATVLSTAARKRAMNFQWMSIGCLWKQNWITSGIHRTFFCTKFPDSYCQSDNHKCSISFWVVHSAYI